MSDNKNERRDKFSWAPGDVEIIKAPDTKPTRKPKAAPAAGKADTSRDDVSPPREGESRTGETKG